ncbi:MAG: MoaD/ThiS family protein [Candidatus Aminicenantia bacterium]
MKIKIKTYGLLRKYIPGEKNPYEMEIEEGATVSDLLKILKIPEEYIPIVTLSDKKVALSYTIKNGDELTFLPIMGGG